MKITLYTIQYKDRDYIVGEDQSKLYPPASVKVWDFDCRPYTGETSVELASRLRGGNVVDQNGIAPNDSSTSAARGMYLATLLIEGWIRTQTIDGKTLPLPVTPANVASLPACVCIAFEQSVETVGKLPTPEAVAAAGEGSASSTTAI